jgi:hypothetical protein
MEYTVENIEAMIYTIRGQRVMLDSDLAKLYGVETKRLIEQVKRNPKRFPSDFILKPNSEVRGFAVAMCDHKVTEQLESQKKKYSTPFHREWSCNAIECTQ